MLFDCFNEDVFFHIFSKFVMKNWIDFKSLSNLCLVNKQIYNLCHEFCCNKFKAQLSLLHIKSNSCFSINFIKDFESIKINVRCLLNLIHLFSIYENILILSLMGLKDCQCSAMNGINNLSRLIQIVKQPCLISHNNIIKYILIYLCNQCYENKIEHVSSLIRNIDKDWDVLKYYDSIDLITFDYETIERYARLIFKIDILSTNLKRYFLKSIFNTQGMNPEKRLNNFVEMIKQPKWLELTEQEKVWSCQLIDLEIKNQIDFDKSKICISLPPALVFASQYFNLVRIRDRCVHFKSGNRSYPPTMDVFISVMKMNQEQFLVANSFLGYRNIDLHYLTQYLSYQTCLLRCTVMMKRFQSFSPLLLIHPVSSLNQIEKKYFKKWKCLPFLNHEQFNYLISQNRFESLMDCFVLGFMTNQELNQSIENNFI